MLTNRAAGAIVLSTGGQARAVDLQGEIQDRGDGVRHVKKRGAFPASGQRSLPIAVQDNFLTNRVDISE